MIHASRLTHRSRTLIAIVTLCLALTGCKFLPTQLDADERERLAAESQRALFEGQEPLDHPLALSEAVARAIKYQADHRQRQMEQAAAAAQIDVGKFDLLPKIAINAGYTTRNNEAFGFGFSPSGQVAANPSASSEATRETLGIGLAWNLLDFGVSYFRQRQLVDQKLIAEERRRKAVQTLMHDVRITWWRAEAAQRLLPAADALLAEIDRTMEKTRVIEARRLLPPLQTATLRRALLDLGQQISFRRQELAQSRVELAALVNVPPGTDLRVDAPKKTARKVLDLTADIEKLEALALRARPEMSEEGYRARISQSEARKALVALLPGTSFDVTGNYDSNRFLLNNVWGSAGIGVLFNLVKVFSLPALNRAADAQKGADDARRLAMAMAIMAQTRIAAVRYQLIADEFLIWDEGARDDALIVDYLGASADVGIDNEIELIRAKARAMTSQMNRDLSYANLQASVARLYNSVGYDAVPPETETSAVADLAEQVQARFKELERSSFSAPLTQKVASVAVGNISGIEPRIAELMREGAGRVLEASKLAITSPTAADVRLDFAADIPPTSQEGLVTASVTVTLLRKQGGANTTAPAKFNTTLSAPIDDEQWRVFGEGAIYKILGDLSPPRMRQPSLPIVWATPPTQSPPASSAAPASGK
jgi:outer membrane protein TolC